MTKHFELKPGESVHYATKPAGLGDTILYAKGSSLGDGKLTSRAILCCHNDELIEVPKDHPMVEHKLSGTGALNKVTNVGPVPLTIWTNI